MADVLQPRYVGSASFRPSALWSTCSPHATSYIQINNWVFSRWGMLCTYRISVGQPGIVSSLEDGRWPLGVVRQAEEVCEPKMTRLTYIHIYRYLITVVSHISSWGAGELYGCTFHPVELSREKTCRNREALAAVLSSPLSDGSNTQLLCCSNVLPTILTWKHLSSQSAEYEVHEFVFSHIFLLLNYNQCCIVTYK